MENTDDGLEYYYVFYSCIGLLGGASIIRQRRVAGKPPGDFNIAGATAHLYRLLEIPVIVQSWSLITKQRADELNRYAELVLKDIEGLSVKTKDNATHLRLVPETGSPATPPPPMEPGPFTPPPSGE